MCRGPINMVLIIKIWFFRIRASRIACRWFWLISGNDSNLLIVFYVQIMPDDFVMQLHRF